MRFAILAIASMTWVTGGRAEDPPKSVAPLGANKRIPVLIVSGSDTFHDWRRTTPQLRATLDETGRFDVRVVEDAEALAVPAVTRRYRTIILNG